MFHFVNCHAVAPMPATTLIVPRLHTKGLETEHSWHTLVHNNILEVWGTRCRLIFGVRANNCVRGQCVCVWVCVCVCVCVCVLVCACVCVCVCVLGSLRHALPPNIWCTCQNTYCITTHILQTHILQIHILHSWLALQHTPRAQSYFDLTACCGFPEERTTQKK